MAFFNELRKYLNQASENYDNFIVMGNFNIDIRQTSPESHKLDEFGSLFSLTNITKSGTCFTKFHSSTIGLFLTNKPNFLQKKQTLSKLTLATITNSYVRFLIFYDRLKPKIVYCRNYKKLNETNFLNNVKNCNFILKTDDPNENYHFLTNTFINIVNNHAPLKKKFIRGNQAPFMTRNLRKEIHTKSSFRNEFCKDPTKENEKLYKKQRNKCVALRRICIK